MIARACWLTALLVPLALVGCRDGSPGPGPSRGGPAPAVAEVDESAVRANLAKLAPEDRPLAESQKFCAVQTKNRLGEMAPPAVVVVKGQRVFLCCEGCQDKALADPDATLARVERLREGAADRPVR